MPRRKKAAAAWRHQRERGPDLGRVTAGFFDVLGVQPALGRTFVEGDDRPGGPRLAVISNGLWSRRFGQEREVVGRTIGLNGVPTTIVGVRPRR